MDGVAGRLVRCGSPHGVESQDLELDLGLVPSAHLLQAGLLVLLGELTPGVAALDVGGGHDGSLLSCSASLAGTPIVGVRAWSPLGADLENPVTHDRAAATDFR